MPRIGMRPARVTRRVVRHVIIIDSITHQRYRRDYYEDGSYNDIPIDSSGREIKETPTKEKNPTTVNQNTTTL